MKVIAIIGAGPLGRWLAQQAARAGFRVVLEDVMPGALRRAREELEAIDIPGLKIETRGTQNIDMPGPNTGTGGTHVTESSHPFSVRHGGLREDGPRDDGLVIPGPKTGTWGTYEDGVSNVGEWGGGISLVSTIEDAVREADLVIDCVPDELESKLEIFCLLDRMAPPRTVLMTPTTQLSIADLASCTYRADQCVAIVEEPAQLADLAKKDVLLRTTSRAAPETMETVREFWVRLGFAVRVERDPRE